VVCGVMGGRMPTVPISAFRILNAQSANAIKKAGA